MFVEMKVRGLALDAVSTCRSSSCRRRGPALASDLGGHLRGERDRSRAGEGAAPRPDDPRPDQEHPEAVDARVGKVVVTDLRTTPSSRSCTSSWVTPSTRSTRGPRTRSRLALRVARRSTSTRTSSARPRASSVQGASRRRPTIRSKLREWLQNIKAGGLREVQQGLSGGAGARSRSSPTTTCRSAGRPTSVETLRAGSRPRARGLVFGPGSPRARRRRRGSSATPRSGGDLSRVRARVPYSRRAARLVAALDVDVFHAHHPFLPGAGRAPARAAATARPLVFTYHTALRKVRALRPLRRQFVEHARRPAEHTLRRARRRRHRAVRSDSQTSSRPGRGQPDRRRPDGPRPGAVPPADRRAARARLPVPRLPRSFSTSGASTPRRA